MDYLLDSNAVSDLSAGHSKLSACVSSVRAPDRVLTCTIVRGEMLFGLAKMPVGKRRNSIELRVHDALRGLPCEPIPASAADAYAEIKTARRRLGLPLDDNDCWIAATAKVLGCTLVSRDADFGRIDGLMLEDWTR